MFVIGRFDALTSLLNLLKQGNVVIAKDLSCLLKRFFKSISQRKWVFLSILFNLRLGKRLEEI